MLEQLDLITGKTAEYLKIIGDFSDWCAANIVENNIDLKECYYILEDFVKSNEHIIQKINHQKQMNKEIYNNSIKKIIN